jgi:hypothetical protein
VDIHDQSCQTCDEYHILIMNMTLDALTQAYAKSNLCLFTFVDTLLGLNVIMLKLEALHNFFVCDFIHVHDVHDNAIAYTIM